jgi:hypothetical protein
MLNPLTLLKPSSPVTQRPHRCRPVTDDNVALSCGWFDSSFELTHGLCVHEISSSSDYALDLWLACQAAQAEVHSRHDARLN